VFVSKRYPDQVCSKGVDLVAAGLPVARITDDLGTTDRTIYAIGAIGVGQASVGAQPN